MTTIAHDHGALIIFDEVLTGFRVGPAGYWGVEEASKDSGGFRADLFCFGKVIGGGLPVAAIGGRRDIMELLAPLGPVYQAGTLSGNPVAVAAGIATLQGLTPRVYRKLDRTAHTIADAASAALTEEGVAHRIQWAGNLFSIVFGEEAAASGLHDYAAVQRQETFRYPPFFHAMLNAGVSLPPSLFEAWFVTAAHDKRAIARILTALPTAAKAAATATPPAS